MTSSRAPPAGQAESLLGAAFRGFTKGALQGAVSIGSSLLLNEIGAPPILQSFLPNLLGQLAGNTLGDGLFKRLTDSLAKFGKGVVSTAGNVISFGAKVLESGASLVKEGFAKAVDFFSGIFDRKTQEMLVQAGGGSIEEALNQNCSVIMDGVHCAYQSIEIDYLLASDRLSYKNSSVSATFDKLNRVGELFQGSIAFAEEAGPDGIRLSQEYQGGQLNKVKMLKGLEALLEINPFSEHVPLSFENGLLKNGVLSLSGDNALEISMRNGVIEKYIGAVSRNNYLDPNGTETFETVFAQLERDQNGNYISTVRIENPFVDNISGLAGARDRTKKLADIFFGGGINNHNEPGVSVEYANLFVQEFAKRGLTLESVPLFEGTNTITGVYHMAKEMYFTDPLNKDKIKEAILNRIEQQPLAPGEKLKLVLYSGAGQQGLEAAQELGDQFGVQFSDIVLLDTFIFFDSPLSNVERIHLFEGDHLNFSQAYPSIGGFTPFLLRPEGGIEVMNLAPLFKLKRYKFQGFGHLDFVDENNISTVVDYIRNLLESEGNS